MSSQQKLRRSILVALASLPLLAALPAQANDPGQRAIQVVERLLAQAHGAMTSGQNGTALRHAINGAFAFDIWERFLLQRHDGAFDNRQMQEFRQLLPGFMAHLYREQFALGLTREPMVGQAHKVRKDMMVSSEFYRGNGQALPVDWRVRELGEPRVIDMMVGGTSFLTLKRDEFQAILNSEGPDGLLNHMRSRAL